LQSYGITVHVHDPLAEADEAVHEYGVRLASWEDLPKATALVGAVAHHEFLTRAPTAYAEKLCDGGIFVDVKSAHQADALRELGLKVWRL
jgi:UDP-N-acetyl-D-galactosamine dehydrogenase